MPDKIKVIGLTGPIAAGKDEVARCLGRRGAAVIEADRLAHALYLPQSPLWHELVKAFGSKILVRGGKINRKRLAEIVFADKKKLRQLDRLVHPYLKAAIIKELEHGTRSTEHGTLIVINAAVLKEIGLLEVVDQVWVVIASRETRLKRLLRSGLDKKAALRRINSQISQAAYLKMADVVIRNDGTKRELKDTLQRERAHAGW